MDGGEPGVGRGAVFTAQNHGMLTVRGMELQKSEEEEERVSDQSDGGQVLFRAFYHLNT